MIIGMLNFCWNSNYATRMGVGNKVNKHNGELMIYLLSQINMEVEIMLILSKINLL